MLPDILAYMEEVSEGCIREIYLVRKVISEDFFTSAFVLNFEYGIDREILDRVYVAIFNYLDAYPVDWQFSLFLYDRTTEAAVEPFTDFSDLTQVVIMIDYIHYVDGYEHTQGGTP